MSWTWTAHATFQWKHIFRTNSPVCVDEYSPHLKDSLVSTPVWRWIAKCTFEFSVNTEYLRFRISVKEIKYSASCVTCLFMHFMQMSTATSKTDERFGLTKTSLKVLLLSFWYYFWSIKSLQTWGGPSFFSGTGKRHGSDSWSFICSSPQFSRTKP